MEVTQTQRRIPGVTRLLVAAALGIALGLFSTAGDAIHVRVVNGLANSTAPWITLAFAAGAIQLARPAAIAAGVIALLFGVATYYVGFVLSGYGFLLPFWIAWSAAAIGAGAVFGYAGQTWRHGIDRWRVLAVALLSGWLLAESAFRLIGIQFWTGVSLESTYVQVAIADALGAGAAVLLLLDRRQWLAAARAIVPIAVVGLILFLASERLLRWFGGLGGS
jgi:hypothetical protein